MKIYEIIDSEENLSIGCLLYYEKEHEFVIELQEYLDEWTAPLLFTSFVKQGIYTIPRDISFLWVKERIIPSGRQNIGSILSQHKLPQYDEMKFLELSSGKCSQDSLYIKKMENLPEYALKRTKKNLIDVVPLENKILLCFFANGLVKKVGLSSINNVDGINKILNNDQLYFSCIVGTGGYSITFDNSIDIASHLLYEKGLELPLSVDDFISFAKRGLVDTSEACEILECSRQNLSYMINNDQINCIKKNVRGNLFLKGEILLSRQ